MTLNDRVRSYFNLTIDMADNADIVADIKAGVELRGANLWILFCAILIASVGLNVNSNATIIGAMLISPLMGPIVAAGFALSAFDFELFRNSLRSLFFAVGLSLLISFCYFYLSPLDTAASELLARTNPTLWDVLIAFFGGVAGMVGVTRRSKGNVIPGVAIATALMPPICTAGYGLATAQFSFFFGAIYLFLINALFIAMGSLFVIRSLHISQPQAVNRALQSKIRWYISIAMLLVSLPSGFLAYRLAKHEINKARIGHFLSEKVETENRYVVKQSYNPGLALGSGALDVSFVGQDFSESEIDGFEESLKRFGLGGLKLTLKNLNKQEAERSSKVALLEKLYDSSELSRKDLEKKLVDLEKELISLRQASIDSVPVEQEAKVLFPGIKSVHVGVGKDTSTKEAFVFALVFVDDEPDLAQKATFSQWLKVRTGRHVASLVYQTGR